MEDVAPHFKELLHKIAKEQNFVDYDLDIKPISSGGANYTSKLYTATISEGSNKLHLFAKIAAIGEKFRNQVPKIYATELYCYTQLIKIYDQLQNDHQVPDEHRLVFPKFYGCNPNLFKETIVLENLVVSGYNPYNRFKCVDWPYAKTAVQELAKMHATSFAHQKYYPEDFKEVLEKFRFDWPLDDPAMKVYMDKVISKAVGLIRDENRRKMERYYETFDSKLFAATFKSCRRPVLGHGDYRPSNLMHKNLDDGKVEIKIVDLQTLQGGSPVTDLIYFIFTGSDEEFRAKYYEKLIDHYYTQLSAAMKRLHLDPEEVFSREDFEYELKEKLPFGLSLAVFALPIVTVDQEDAPVVNEDLEVSNFSVEKTSDLYTERLNGVVNDYVKWGILK